MPSAPPKAKLRNIVDIEPTDPVEEIREERVLGQNVDSIVDGPSHPAERLLEAHQRDIDLQEIDAPALAQHQLHDEEPVEDVYVEEPERLCECADQHCRHRIGLFHTPVADDMCDSCNQPRCTLRYHGGWCCECWGRWCEERYATRQRKSLRCDGDPEEQEPECEP